MIHDTYNYRTIINKIIEYLKSQNNFSEHYLMIIHLIF